jgi:hypothetical protein
VPDYTTLDSHDWEGAAYFPLTLKQAKEAERNGKIKTKTSEELVIRIVEVVCRHCRRVFEDVLREDGTMEDCVIGIHLRGGPIGERKKRKGVMVADGTTDYDVEDDDPDADLYAVSPTRVGQPIVAPV